MINPSTHDRAIGSLVGLAVGDALGTTLEFSRPSTFAPITDMIGGGPFSLAPGQFTDDTSMALCLGESLLACHGFDAHDQMSRYVRWWRDGHGQAPVGVSILATWCRAPCLRSSAATHHRGDRRTNNRPAMAH